MITRCYWLLFCFLHTFYWSDAQLSLERRLILIGDAGEINDPQADVMVHARGQVIKDITTVFFLGDNIYPSGYQSESSDLERRSQDILKSQYAFFQDLRIPIYFIPGNHDWANSGKDGLKTIQAQGRFIEGLSDSLIRMIPRNGCPGPVEVALSENLAAIVLDSEWWLFPYERNHINQECENVSEAEVIAKVEELIFKNQDKTVLFIGHHPLQTNGSHGGHFSWKDHLFPLTNVKSGLYVPLPGIGSLYPLLRKTAFQNPEDLTHPKYKSYRDRLYGAFDSFPNLVYIGGHEHGLQLLKDSVGRLQVVSGSGAKATFLKKKSNTLFLYEKQGYVVLDYMSDRSIVLRYFIYANGTVSESFEYVIPYQKVLMDGVYQKNMVEERDSITATANESFNKKGRWHRWLFGENYRKEWAEPTMLPVLKVSEIGGGLKPVKKGGGMQTASLRMVDTLGREWVLRGVNKSSESLLPSIMYHTFAHDLLDDAVSAQHPYSALIVKPIAEANNIPATDPIIGVVASDSLLGRYNIDFANKINLLELREPLGDSDNTPKMIRKLFEDNDNTLDATTFFRSRLMDVLIGDWDRHEDQFRWHNTSSSKDKDYLVVPRDRDQVLRLMEGIVPKFVSLSWVMPTIQGFDSVVRDIGYSLIKSDFLNAHPQMQFTRAEYQEIVGDFVNKTTDSVLRASVGRLPIEQRTISGERIYTSLKKRRDALPRAMDEYYKFVNRIVDIRLTAKRELVEVYDAANGGVRILVREINKDGEVKKLLMDRDYDPKITRELRLYLSGGIDSLVTDYSSTAIKLRVVGSDQPQQIDLRHTGRKIEYYSNSTFDEIGGRSSKKGIKTHRSKDPNNIAFIKTNRYNVLMPLFTMGYNLDDGFMLGGGFKYTKQEGFRKVPFSSQHSLLAAYYFGTSNFKINYEGVWNGVFGDADLAVLADVFAPNNTQNFFGVGNGSVFEKGRDIGYYRTRFHLYQLSPELRWQKNSNLFKLGIGGQHYDMKAEDNDDRFTLNSVELIHNYDSLSMTSSKQFVYLYAGYRFDNRDNKILPNSGRVLELNVGGYHGINSGARSFVQLTGEFSFYQSVLNNRLVLSNRLGGGITGGDATFYQKLFLGGQGNLYGYRKHRFAGDHLLFNNFEARFKLMDLRGYMLPGQLGITGFYDLGRVWSDYDDNAKLHHGVGGSLYYAPAQLLLFQFSAAHGEEGWLPIFKLGLRF